MLTKWRTCTYVENSFAKWLGANGSSVLLEEDEIMVSWGWGFAFICSKECVCHWWIHQVEQMPSRPRVPLSPGLQLTVDEGRAIRLWQKELEQPLRRLGAGNVKIRQGNFAWLHAYPIPIHLTSIGSLLEMWKLTQLMESAKCSCHAPPLRITT